MYATYNLVEIDYSSISNISPYNVIICVLQKTYMYTCTQIKLLDNRKKYNHHKLTFSCGLHSPFHPEVIQAQQSS